MRRESKQRDRRVQHGTGWQNLGVAAALAVAVSLPAAAQNQGTFHSAPATDVAAQASPTQTAKPARATDAAIQASPGLGAMPRRSASLPAGVTLQVKLGQAIDSGKLKNGQTVPATLVEGSGPVTSGLKPGMPVQITVVETVPAGKIYAAGEFSLQVTQVGATLAATDILTFRGTPGKRDIADAAPRMGVDAGLPAGAALTFRTQPPPSFDVKAATGTETIPGAVSGNADGAPPPPQAQGASPFGVQGAPTPAHP